MMGSDALERPRGTGRGLCLDVIAEADHSSEYDDPHDSRPSYPDTFSIAVADLLQETGLEGIDLGARVPHTGHRDKCGVAEPKHRSDGEVVKLESPRRDVLAEVARGHVKALGGQHVEQLAGDEVYLSEIGLGRVGSDARAMLHEGSGVRISGHPDTGDQTDIGNRPLGESVRLAEVECGDRSHD
jgi:hypothetical protein